MPEVEAEALMRAMNPASEGTRRDIGVEPEAEQPGGRTATNSEADQAPISGENVPVPESDAEMDTLVLRNKTMKQGSKGKELDPRSFDETEWKLFRKAHAEQWQAHIASGAVRIVPKEDVAGIDPSRILPLPARFVRTNKGTDSTLKPKSRLVVPGHVAPKEEDVRTDAPVAPQVSLYVMFALSVQKNWQVGSFDVKDAFLSGRENTRELYVRPPKEGIKGLPDGVLIQLVKGVFGLKESPRLWWLQLRDAILEAGFEVLRSVPGTFVI